MVTHHWSPIALRSRREALGLTRQMLAEHIGVGAGAIRGWERGDSYPRDPQEILGMVSALEETAAAHQFDLMTEVDPTLAPGESDRALLYTWRSQADYATWYPQLAQRVPVATHRALTGQVAAALTMQGVEVEVIDPGPRPNRQPAPGFKFLTPPPARLPAWSSERGEQ